MKSSVKCRGWGIHWAVATCLGIVLTGCGGGGSSSSTAGPSSVSTASTSTVSSTVTWAKSGVYLPVIKPEGSTSADPFLAALSLVHPDNPTVEYILDASAAPNWLGYTLQKGIYDPAIKQFTGLVPVAYIDAPNGSVRTTILSATGLKPAQTQVGALSLCSDSIIADNFTNPFATEIALTTSGADGVCGTADDKSTLVTFTSGGAPIINSNSAGKKYVAYVTSTATGLPTGWLVTYPTGQVSIDPIGAGSQYLLSFATTPTPTLSQLPTYTFVAQSDNLLLYSKSGQLFSLSTAGASPAVKSISTATGVEGWKYAGSDVGSMYVYLNSNTATSGLGTWRMLSISRSNQATATLATGTGSIAGAGATGQRIFATVASSAIEVVQISTPGGTVTNFIPASSSTATFILARPKGKHLFVTASGGNSISAGVIDEAGVKLFAPTSGLFYGVEQPSYSITENSFVATNYLFLTGLSSAVLSGSDIVAFDTATSTTRTLGTIPTVAVLGGAAGEQVYAGTLRAYAKFGGTSINRVSGGQYLSSGRGVYTYRTDTQNGLKKTTIEVR